MLATALQAHEDAVGHGGPLRVLHLAVHANLRSGGRRQAAGRRVGWARCHRAAAPLGQGPDIGRRGIGRGAPGPAAGCTAPDLVVGLRLQAAQQPQGLGLRHGVESAWRKAGRPHVRVRPPEASLGRCGSLERVLDGRGAKPGSQQITTAASRPGSLHNMSQARAPASWHLAHCAAVCSLPAGHRSSACSFHTSRSPAAPPEPPSHQAAPPLAPSGPSRLHALFWLSPTTRRSHRFQRLTPGSRLCPRRRRRFGGGRRRAAPCCVCGRRACQQPACSCQARPERLS